MINEMHTQACAQTSVHSEQPPPTIPHIQTLSELSLQQTRTDSNFQAGLSTLLPESFSLTPLPSAPAPFFSKAAQRRSSTTLSLEPSTRTSSSKSQKRPLASSAPPTAGKRTWWKIQDHWGALILDGGQSPGLLFPPLGVRASETHSITTQTRQPRAMLPTHPHPRFPVRKPQNHYNPSVSGDLNPASVLISCVTLGNLLPHSEPHFFLCKMETDNTFLRELWWGINKGKHSVNYTFYVHKSGSVFVHSRTPKD